MPTDRPRLTITETDDVVAMLELAAERWPEDADHHGRLLKRLAAQGAAVLSADRERWAATVRGAAGAAGVGAYPPGYRDELLGDWPA